MSITIASESHLWLLWDPADHDGPDPAVSEGFMAEMLGVDRLTLRGMYADFLARENAPSAREVQRRQVRIKVEKWEAERARRAERAPAEGGRHE